jgi:type IV pilus assembly protein PilW
MKRLNHHRSSAAVHARGFTLIELLVAMLLALFLVGGLLTLEQSTRKAFGNQNQLVQLQDDERLAMTLLAEVTEASGYFPNPVLYTQSGEFPSTTTPAYAVYASAGQSVFGESAVSAQGDLLTVRYVTAPGDNIINCTGGTNPSTAGAPVLWVNTFSIDASNNLNCQLNGNAAIGLVSGVTNMSILYGVKTNFSVTNTSADSYLTAAQMTNADWMNVVSVQVSLTFTNPLYGGGPGSTNYNTGQPATITFSRVICVMAKGGVNS